MALSQGIIKYPLAILPATCYKSTRFQGRVTEVAGHLGSSDTDAKRRVRGHSVLQRSPDTLEVRTAATRAHGSPTPDRYRGRRTPWKFGPLHGARRARETRGYRGRRTPWKFGRLGRGSKVRPGRGYRGRRTPWKFGPFGFFGMDPEGSGVTEVAGHLGSSDDRLLSAGGIRPTRRLQRSPDTLEVRTGRGPRGRRSAARYRGRRTPWKFGQEATRGQSRGPDAGYRGRRTPWKFGRLPGRRGVGLMFIKLSLTSSRRAPLSAVACLPGRRGGGLGFKPRGEHEGKEVRHAAAPGAVNGQNTGAVACPRRRRRKATNEAV